MKTPQLIEKLYKYIHNNSYTVSIIVIICIAIVTRFYNFNNHWGIGNDDARDVLIAQEALRRHELPMIGSFSSAGPFVFGPLFYWVVMVSLLLFPFTYTAPWILTCLMSVALVYVLIITAKQLAGEKFAIITGILAALSPQMIGRALSLGQHSYVAITTALLILSFCMLWKTQKTKYAIYMGLALGIGISMHYQVINLLIFFTTIFFIPNTNVKQKSIFLFAMIVSFIIPTLPIIIWDAQQNFANTRNILDYLLVAQYRIYVPNSWKLFLFQFFPTYWAFVIGVFKPIGLGLLILSGILLPLKTVQKKIPAPLIPLSIIFFVLAVLNRYYHGERSEGYLLYLQPFIILISSYAIYILTSEGLTARIPTVLSKIFGYSMLGIILCANLTYLYQHVIYISPVASVRNAVAEIKMQYPNSKFSVYDYKWENSPRSQPLSFLLHQENLIDKNGLPIGLNSQLVDEVEYPIITNITGVQVFGLSEATTLQDKNVWVNVNPESLYDDLMRWGKKPQLKSNYKFPWEK